MTDNFLQSELWGEFQKAAGRKIWRIGKTLVIKHNLPFGKSYLYCPRGEVSSWEMFLEEARRIAGREKSIFLKVEPTELRYKIQDTGYKLIKSKREIQPSKTIVLDIAQPEEELLNQMHPKTRYNLRLARRKGVRAEQGSADNVEDFLKLAKQTARRDKFHLHPDEYYRKMMEVLGRDGMARIFLAKYRNRIIAADLVVFFGQTATYLHGASDYGFRRLMAPYLLKWREISVARQEGLKYYDFYGISEKKWPGVTRFKKGFLPDDKAGGGKEVNYPGAYDLVFSSFWYMTYNLLRRIF